MYESLHVWQMARQNLSADAAIYLYIKLPLAAVLMTPHFISLQSNSLSV